MRTDFRTSEELTRPNDGELHDLSLSDNDLSPGVFRFALAIIAGLMVLAIAGTFVE
jgi:hypothetical protein